MIIELRKAIEAEVKKVISNTFYQMPSKSTSLPYATYNLLNSSMDETREDFILEIDTWHESGDSTTIETESQSLKDALDGFLYSTDTLSFRVYLTGRFSPPTNDTTVTRRQLRFEVLTY